jgi:hypothetical protein
MKMREHICFPKGAQLVCFSSVWHTVLGNSTSVCQMALNWFKDQCSLSVWHTVFRAAYPFGKRLSYCLKSRCFSTISKGLTKGLTKGLPLWQTVCQTNEQIAISFGKLGKQSYRMANCLHTPYCLANSLPNLFVVYSKTRAIAHMRYQHARGLEAGAAGCSGGTQHRSVVRPAWHASSFMLTQLHTNRSA